MFFTDTGLTPLHMKPKVERAYMDGSNRVSLFTGHGDHMHSPTGIVLDAVNSRIYWCDNRLDYIHTADYNGHNR